MAELGQRFLAVRFGTVQLGALPEHGLQAMRLRTVGIVHGFTFGVVLAVDGHPLLGHHGCAQPQPEAEEVRRNGVQVHRPVRLVPVQENGHAGDGDVGRHQRVEHDLPPGKVPEALAQPVQGGMQKGPVGQQHGRAFDQTMKKVEGRDLFAHPGRRKEPIGGVQMGPQAQEFTPLLALLHGAAAQRRSLLHLQLLQQLTHVQRHEVGVRG